MTVEEKLFVVKLYPSAEKHISVNPDVCLMCKGKECTKFCPGNVFAWSTIDEELIIGYENCLECGACKIGCPYEVIEFNYPKAPFGTHYSGDRVLSGVGVRE